MEVIWYYILLKKAVCIVYWINPFMLEELQVRYWQLNGNNHRNQGDFPTLFKGKKIIISGDETFEGFLDWHNRMQNKEYIFQKRW